MVILTLKPTTQVKADKEHDKPVKDMQSETLDYLDKKEKENNQ